MTQTEDTKEDKPWQHPGERLLTSAVQEAIAIQMLALAEIPDRTSPEDFPEGYVLTRSEIVGAMLYVLNAALSEPRATADYLRGLEALLADYFAAYPAGRLGDRYRALRDNAGSATESAAAQDQQQRIQPSMISGMGALTSTGPYYFRHPELDKRIKNGDDFAGDAWVRYTAVGERP